MKIYGEGRFKYTPFKIISKYTTKTITTTTKTTKTKTKTTTTTLINY